MPTTPQPNQDLLNILCVRNMVLFPGIVLPISIGRKKSVDAVQDAVRREKPLPIGVLLQKNQDIENPRPEDVYRVGTVADVLRYLTAQDGSHHVICQGQQRFRVIEFLQTEPFITARVERIEEDTPVTKEIEARFLTLKQSAREALQLLPQPPQDLDAVFQSVESPSTLTDMVATYMDLQVAEKQDILETLDLGSRLDKVTRLLGHRMEVLRLSRDISQQTRGSLEKAQRDYFLREQMKTIQKELGESDPKTVEVEELSEAIARSGMPTEAEKEARRELKRLERMPEAAAEFAMIRTYLDWMVELPWAVLTQDSLDIAKAREVLDADHYGLIKVKKRIIEFLAVRKLKPDGRSAILCLVGPPGVGKTSLGQSVARAMGRNFVRISLGGVHDEAEIRGHRRTYIGALPGNIVQGIRKAGSRNPVFMLDELDKLSASFQGDPASALLEVLDPEQNSSFRDNYLGVAFDLSQVMFIATANVLDAIPGPLRDRCEVIEMAGYTEEEKLEIARRYLVRRRVEQNGLVPEFFEITDAAIRDIIRHYTREAGCRNLEREIGAICRRAATIFAEAIGPETAGVPPATRVVEEARNAESESGTQANARPDSRDLDGGDHTARNPAEEEENLRDRPPSPSKIGTRDASASDASPSAPASKGNGDGSSPEVEFPDGGVPGGKSPEGTNPEVESPSGWLPVVPGPVEPDPGKGLPNESAPAKPASIPLPSLAERLPPGTKPFRADVGDLAAILGVPRFEGEVALRTSVPGVATGLAWTPSGGDILFVEATRMPGKGSLILTGQLGDVMKESAQAAISVVKSRAVELALDPQIFEKSDIHIHVPAGAVPKDGPSAGVTMYTALVSLLLGKPPRSDLAMTGEISLRGLVLPVGGIKEKVLAALGAGIKTVLLPARNRKDLEEIPAAAREKLEILWLEKVDDAVRLALLPGREGSGTVATAAGE